MTLDLPRGRQFFLTPFLCVTYFLAIGALYGWFLENPIIFDDANFFDGSVREHYLTDPFGWNLRWLPYATFEWTRIYIGLEIVWFRLGNVFLHGASAIMLFLFLKRLFASVLCNVPSVSLSKFLAPFWLAYCASLIFALHPVAVYAVAYLIQRSILMATLFVLVMWWSLIEGLLRRSRWYLAVSVAAYLLAVLCKEHAIMAPAVGVTIVFMVRKLGRAQFRLIWPFFLAYAAIAMFVVLQVSSNNILANAYEPNGVDILSRFSAYDARFDPKYAYPLSIQTQATLFFKYLVVWILPSSAWMSVDMYEDFATTFWSWVHLVGLAGFIAYPVIAIRLLMRRGVTGLLGFSMLCPWLLFATELSTIRVQESFVLYRSYLWMPGMFACLPFLFQRVTAKRAGWALAGGAVVLMSLSFGRLATFSHPLYLWDDAAKLIQTKNDRPGVERIYHNRGVALTLLKLYPQAIEDFNKALLINPSNAFAYSARGTVYFQTQKYSQALEDFTKAIELHPQHFQAQLGRARVYEFLNNFEAARHDYGESCRMGSVKACEKAKTLANNQ